MFAQTHVILAPLCEEGGLDRPDGSSIPALPALRLRGSIFEHPYRGCGAFAVTAAGSKAQFGATLSTMRPLRCGANPSLCARVRIFEYPCRRCGSIAVALRSQGRSFKRPCPRRGPFVVMLRPRASKSHSFFFYIYKLPIVRPWRLASNHYHYYGPAALLWGPGRCRPRMWVALKQALASPSVGTTL